FAWEKPQGEGSSAEKKDYGFVYAARTFPPHVAMKGLVWGMDQMIGQTDKK
ncbi:MAG: hypothetical protein RIQ56_451, partial [Candidatus Parcubacteria bacterium]